MAQTLIQMGGPSGLPIDILLSSLPSLPRPLLERLVQRAIDHLDDIDGEPDLAVDDYACDEDTDLEPDNDYEPGWLPAESDGQVPVRDLRSD